MDLLLPRATADLARWERRAFWPATLTGPTARDRRDAYEAHVADEPPGDPLPDGPFRTLAAAILRYDVFPPDLLTGVLRRAPVQPGDTVGIRYRLAPFAHLFFAARVTATFAARDADHHRAGFTYRTLRGHPELGEETFAVAKHRPSGRVAVSLQAWSRPGTLLARAGAPVVRALQVHASRAALAHLAHLARATPLLATP